MVILSHERCLVSKVRRSKLIQASIGIWYLFDGQLSDGNKCLMEEEVCTVLFIYLFYLFLYLHNVFGMCKHNIYAIIMCTLCLYIYIYTI